MGTERKLRKYSTGISPMDQNGRMNKSLYLEEEISMSNKHGNLIIPE